MANINFKRKEKEKHLKVANTLSIAAIILLSGAFVLETLINEIKVDYAYAALVMLASLIIVIAILRSTINPHKLASNIPVVLLLFYTLLMIVGRWALPHYLFVSLAFFGISCVYASFIRTLIYLVIQNLFIAYLVIRGTPISGLNVPLIYTLINWAVCIFASIILLMLTRAGTIVLNRALEHRNSFRNLLASTEIYVAMIDDANKVIYASKTLANLGSIENQDLVQGRPFLDLFPGRSLKLFAGRMLKEKENYAEDWEFNLNGQKRYFKAASHSLPGKGGGSLVSLYDMTHLAERDEIAAMKDSMKIGLFFMDQNYVIQDHYSKYLEVMLDETDLFGKLFTDLISDSVTPTELEGIKDYLQMVRERSYDQEMLDDINPFNEWAYTTKNGEKKVFQLAFATIERGQGEIFLLVTVYDITARVELQQRLAEEEAKRQEEMQAVFELLQVEPSVFSDFLGDMEEEFENIDRILKNETMTAHEVLVKVYQSIHAIKSNAVILGLNIFGNKMHVLEAKIKKQREREGEIPFAEMLNLTFDIETISQEKEGFKEILGKIQNYAGSGGGEKQNVKILIESLAMTTKRASEDMEKDIDFVASEVDPEAIDSGPRRLMKEILMQLIRNSVVHGIEKPDVRKEKGKDPRGKIKLSIKVSEDHKHVHMKLVDDGKGLDYQKIAQKALEKNLIKKEDADNNDVLMKAIFMPGFSTAEGEEDGIHAGRGIGLNLVRDRIKEANGTIKLRSETGKGIIFFVSLPLTKKK